MKLSFSTLPCEGWSVDLLIASCQTLGYKGIELKEDHLNAVSLATPEAELTDIAAKFRTAGITITNIGSKIIFNGIGPDEEKALSELKQVIRMASTLRAKGVRIFLGTYLRFVEQRVQPKDEARIITYVQEACDYAKAYGVEIWLETHNEYSTGAVLNQFLQRVDRTNCKVIYDIIHPYEFGEKPEDTIRLLGDRCAHVHVKDGEPFADPKIHEWKYTPMGEGQLPLHSIVSLLLESGYDGYFSFEWEPKWRPELKELNLEVPLVLTDYVTYMKQLAVSK
ncbi:sugar phosphate isomerase/epimerase family protein [Paenibacillus qinlingensis]|uniref:sugar phosphate isomerase/epimerase family protein n=1 Tax=Paenibacillus qinlingensis TaxID=1837343 RepID=UPI00156598E4|nr:sugar phosphate isomerase/epimerase family protein [Paenibacillus qinlingensis]NQX58650.1 sugar phosphate isomerase/epimerase [Paenibacillus qinlingensis]